MIEELFVSECAIEIFQDLGLGGGWEINFKKFLAVLNQVLVIRVRGTRASLQSASHFDPTVASLELVKALN